MVTAALPPDALDEGERSSIVPEADQRFGRYRLLYELASGGMGKVFLARAEGARGFEKLVALKRIHAHLAERREFVDMFLDEARITSRIAHPNVCSVFDFGHEGGTYFIAMEYLFGEPLSHVIRGSVRYDKRDPRRVPHMARILVDACEGLHAAHELRDPDGRPLEVVHRDVSPHNIFVTYDGGVRVVDFGIARAADQLHETTTGAVKGKWAYMAPEQAQGQAVDRRVDVWALGVVLWEGATGRRLFRRRTQTETVLAVVNEEVPRPSELDPSVPPEIDEICMRALSRDPDERWPSARAMGRALSHYLASRGRPVGLAEIAEWMEVLFPGVGERKQSLVSALSQPEPPKPSESVETKAMLPSHLLEALESTSRGRTRAPREATAVTAKDRRPRPTDDARDEAVPRDATTAPGRRAPLPDAAHAWTEPDDVWTPAPLPDEAPPAPAVRSKRGAILGGAALLALVGLGAGGLAWRLSASEPDPQTALPTPAPGDGSPRASSGDGAPRASSEAPDPALAEAPATAPPGPADLPEPLPEAPAPEATSSSPRPSRPPRPRPAPAEAPTGEGTVNVVTTGGWALVFENGRNLGETPVRLTLPAGDHVLEVRPNGQPPGRRVPVTVRPGGSERVTVPID